MIDIHHISDIIISNHPIGSVLCLRESIGKATVGGKICIKVSDQLSTQIRGIPVAKFIHKLQRASKIKGEYYLLKSSPLQNGHSKKLISSLKYSCQKSEAQTDQAEVIQAELLFSSGNGSVPRKSICSQKCAKPGTSSGSLKYPAEKRGFSTIFTHTVYHPTPCFFVGGHE